MKEIKAFTLAEVLITLGVIGIIASMTLPSLVNNIRNNVLQNQLKKTYSELNQISKLFYNDYNMSIPEFTASANGWNQFVTQIFPKYLKMYNKVDDWTHGDKDPDTGLNTDTMPYKLYALGGKTPVASYCDLSGFYVDVNGRYYSINDRPTKSTENGPTICVDINGVKRPNMYGKDFFLFVFTVDGSVIPMGQYHKDNSSGAGGTNPTIIGSDRCKVNQSNYYSLSCTYYAIADISPDGKGTYWKDYLKNK